MIDDFQPATRKPKRIEPLQKEPQRSIHDLAAEHEAAEAVKAAIRGEVPEPSLSGAIAQNSHTPDPTSTFVPPAAKVAHHSRRSRFTWRLDRKTTIVASVVVLLLIGGGLTAVALTRPSGQGGTFVSKRPAKPIPKVTTVANTLSGLQVDAAVNQRPVTGVMIENSTDARPQSGLDQAHVVFEAIAEGGITRFLALFQDTQPDYIGPVRSARPYYVQWCMSFDCALGHAGGSPEALQNIRDWGAKDLDQFASSASYQRISSRYAPHNLYTSIAKLNELEAARGFGAPSFQGFARKKEQPYKAPVATTATQPSKKTAADQPDTRTPATSVNVNISSGTYNSHYDYDATSNSYKRSQAGAAHVVIDGSGAQAQLQPKVVVAMVLPYSIASDKHSQYGVVGTGQVYVFQDGTVTTGSWSKPDIKAPLSFTGADGAVIALNPGQTWITAIGAANLVSYQ